MRSRSRGAPGHCGSVGETFCLVNSARTTNCTAKKNPVNVRLAQEACTVIVSVLLTFKGDIFKVDINSGSEAAIVVLPVGFESTI